MRCVIARFPFDLTKNGVLESMKGIKPEQVTGESVIIGRRTYPIKQVGQVITRQDRRDFSAGEVLRAMTQLGFTCPGPPRTAASSRALSPVQQASAMLGAPAA
ncbi:SCO5918 family protein [Streptomyces noursei]|uniref:SCO5918 family protein n=1 Tax=Streptomyces noursei TaxID=1971 RepID=UPI0035D637D5